MYFCYHKSISPHWSSLKGELTGCMSIGQPDRMVNNLNQKKEIFMLDSWITAPSCVHAFYFISERIFFISRDHLCNSENLVEDGNVLSSPEIVRGLSRTSAPSTTDPLGYH